MFLVRVLVTAKCSKKKRRRRAASYAPPPSSPSQLVLSKPFRIDGTLIDGWKLWFVHFLMQVRASARDVRPKEEDERSAMFKSGHVGSNTKTPFWSHLLFFFSHR